MPSVTIYPGSPLYGLKVNIWEPLQLVLTLPPGGRVNLLVDQASARVVELQQANLQGENQFTSELVSDYQSKMSAADASAHSINDAATKTAAYQRIASATALQIQILKQVYEDANPGQQYSVLAAVNLATFEHQTAIQILTGGEIQAPAPATPPTMITTFSVSESSASSSSVRSQTTTVTTSTSSTSTNTWTMSSPSTEPTPSVSLSKMHRPFSSEYARIF